MILESRLVPDPSTIEPPAYKVGPEWTNTEYDDLADWLSDAADSCPDIELCPDEERPTVYGGDGCLIYRWPDTEDAWHYTAVRDTA